MQPTIGRIVHYTLAEGDVPLIDQQAPAVPGADGPERGQVLPAMVVATFGGQTANLKVFLDGKGEYWATSRSEGDQPGTWAWPPRA